MTILLQKLTDVSAAVLSTRLSNSIAIAQHEPCISRPRDFARSVGQMNVLALGEWKPGVRENWDSLKCQHNIYFIIDHEDVIKWKDSLRYWPFLWGINRSPVNSPHKGQWRGALMFSLICAWTNGWVNNRNAGDLRHHRAHHDVIVMIYLIIDQLISRPFLHLISRQFYAFVLPLSVLFASVIPQPFLLWILWGLIKVDNTFPRQNPGPWFNKHCKDIVSAV